MKTIESYNELAAVEPGGVLTIGNFDGLHLGHQAIMARARRCARQRSAALTVMTFEPHPIAVLRPDQAPPSVTPPAMKRHLLAALGATYFHVIPTDRRLLELCPEDFVRRFIVDVVRPSLVVEGHDFTFGAGRSGNLEVLAELGAMYGFQVAVVEPEQVKLPEDGLVRVSSTLIRRLVAEGEVARAAAVLGRPYRLAGPVIRGKGKGRQLGFPTVNMALPAQVIPAHGVYAGYAAIGDDLDAVCSVEHGQPAVFSIGSASTISRDQTLLIEAHFIGLQVPDAAGRHLAMDFIQRLRPQQKFPSEAELSAHIAKDCRHAEAALSAAGG